jgi:GxxExxY protein
MIQPLNAEDAEDAADRRGKVVNENAIGNEVLKSAMKVHTSLGPGLLESVYELCLVHELTKSGLKAERQVALPLHYGGLEINGGFRVDILVEGLVVIEVKAVEKLMPVHKSQLLTYSRLNGCKLGYLLNFNIPHMRDGIKRVVNGL